MLCLGGEESLVVLVGHDDFLAQHLAQFGHGLLVASLGPLAGIPGGSSIGHDGQCHGSGHCGFLVAHCEYPVMNKTPPPRAGRATVSVRRFTTERQWPMQWRI